MCPTHYYYHHHGDERMDRFLANWQLFGHHNVRALTPQSSECIRHRDTGLHYVVTTVASDVTTEAIQLDYWPLSLMGHIGNVQ